MHQGAADVLKWLERRRSKRAPALAVAQRLSESQERACRSVGKDALRELSSAKRRAAVARRAG